MAAATFFTSITSAGLSFNREFNISTLAVSSGGATNITLSNLPGLLNAASTLHGALVAASISTPSLLDSAPSSSAKNWLITCRMADCFKSLLLAPIASASSKNNTQGLLRRASSKISCRFFSLLPIHMSKISCRPMLMNLASISPAVAFAINVLPQPGGPYNKIPPPLFFPNALNNAGFSIGCIILIEISSFTFSIPPTSAKRIEGFSIK